MGYDKEDEVIEELFESPLYRYQIGIETSMGDSEFMFDSVCLLHYNCHKMIFKRDWSYIDSPDWIKTKKQQ